MRVLALARVQALAAAGVGVGDGESVRSKSGLLMYEKSQQLAC